MCWGGRWWGFDFVGVLRQSIVWSGCRWCDFVGVMRRGSDLVPKIRQSMVWSDDQWYDHACSSIKIVVLNTGGMSFESCHENIFSVVMESSTCPSM